MTLQPLLLQAFRQPDALSGITLPAWDLLIRQARQANVLASLDALLRESGLLEKVPPQPRAHLEWAHCTAQRHRQTVHWEIAQISKALDSTGLPAVFLKGAAYVLADLPLSSGRLFSDIDIMVPKASLPDVESALLRHGWAATHHDEYDQHYYRAWMHELPPMRHVTRMTYIDVHHAIVPETAPIKPDSAKLLAAAVAVEGHDGLRVLAPVDMVLHSAVHLFHDGEMNNGLRDLLDIDGLLRRFGTQAGFWPSLTRRAAELELTRPLFYALRYATRLLHTPVPADAMHAAQAGQPPLLLLKLMDMLFNRALLPAHSSCSDWLSNPARSALYLRGNWLRMPPLLLTRHLFHKAFISPKEQY